MGVVDGSYGAGKFFLPGPEVAMRGQSQGTFKFVFNAIEYGPASAGKAAPRKTAQAASPATAGRGD